MVDKELIENWRNMVKLLISSLLFKTNYEGMGEQDKEEFERDFDEILDLALIGLKHKAQLSQEGTTKGTTTDTISRQAAIDVIRAMQTYKLFAGDELILVDKAGVMTELMMLPPAQPEQPTEVQDILQYLDEYLHPIVSPEHWSVYSELYDMISMLPSAQPEQKKGKWKCDENGDWHCSVCKAIVERDEQINHYWQYCYHCGAKMEETNE